MPSPEYDRLVKKLRSVPPPFSHDVHVSRAGLEKAGSYFPGA